APALWVLRVRVHAPAQPLQPGRAHRSRDLPWHRRADVRVESGAPKCPGRPGGRMRSIGSIVLTAALWVASTTGWSVASGSSPTIAASTEPTFGPAYQQPSQLSPSARLEPVRGRTLVMAFENVTREGRIFWLGEGSAVLLADDLNAL